MGKGGIENLLQQQQKDASPFNAEFRIGGLYDSRVGSSSGGADKDTDSALAASLTAGWQAPLKGDVGLRLDYNGYADFHKDYNQYNVIDQSLSLEPQYRHGPFIYSLPFSVNFVREKGGDDYNRYSVYPTVTYLFPSGRQAVALYGIAGRIEDRDNDTARNEDGKALGGGCAYVHAFENRSRVRLSLDYQHTAYEASVVEYGTSSLSTDKRADNAVVAGLDFLFPLTDHLGLYVNYAFIRSHSNVDLFEYNRHVVQGGVSLRF